MPSFLTYGVSEEMEDKSVLVTGGTGSFGKQFIRTVLKRYRPRRLIVFSRDEQKHFEMEREFDDRTYPAIRYFIGDVRDRDRLEFAMRSVDIVIHAAAMKHVPLAEYNPTECIQTNVNGGENVATAALRAGVKKVIALSSDKAVNPINLYGASKLAADKVFVAANNLRGRDGTRLSVVRYGNVVGSRGSVVPLFRSLIDKGADHLPITDPRMTRFWVTLQQGVDFVLACLTMMQGGEIFVPKLPSMRMVDLARCMAPGLPHRVVGIRPGEKLHEVLIAAEDARNTLELEDRYIIQPLFAFWTLERAPEGAHPVDENFRYASDTNGDWLDEERLRRMLAESAP